MIGYKKYLTAKKIVEQYISEQKELIKQHELIKHDVKENVLIKSLYMRNKARVMNVLHCIGIDTDKGTIGDLRKIDLELILKYRNIGKGTYYELKDIIK